MTVEQKPIRPVSESPFVIFSVCSAIAGLIGILPHLWMNHQSWAFVVAGTLVIALGLTVALAPGRKG